MSDRVRLTVSVPSEALDVFRSMADAAGISVGRCIGDWLADTADGAQLVAAKMQEAKRAPRRVMQEVRAMLRGAHGEAGDVLEALRRKGRSDRAGDAAGAPARSAAPPSSNTGGKSPKRGHRKP